MFKISFEEPAPIRDFIRDCPEVLQRVISRLLQKDAQLRYQTLRDVQFDLEPLRRELQEQGAAGLLLRAQELLANKQLEEAHALVLEALVLDPSNRPARSLREDVQRGLRLRALRPRIDGLIKSGDDAVAGRRFSEALQSFEAASRLDESDVDLQRRVEHSRALFVNFTRACELLGRAREEIGRQDLAAAFGSVAEALRHDPQNPEAADLHGEIEKAMELQRRQRAEEEAVNKAEALSILGDYDEAIAVLERFDDPIAGSPVPCLLNRIREEREEHERVKRLTEGLAGASGILRQGRFEDAAGRLEILKAEFPANKEVARLLSYATAELAARARTQAVQAAIDTVNGLLDAKDFATALSVVDRSLRDYPGEGLLIRCLSGVMSAKAAWEHETAIESAISTCALLQSNNRFIEAIQLAESTKATHGDDPRLEALLQRLAIGWRDLQRINAVNQTAEEARKLLDKNQPERALLVLQQAVAQYGSDAGLAALITEAHELQRSLERARAVCSSK